MRSENEIKTAYVTVWHRSRLRCDNNYTDRRSNDFQNAHLFESGRLTAFKVPLIVLGVILISLGIFMWIQAVIIAEIDDGIKQNELVTTGICGLVRDPICSAIMIACTGVVLMCANAFFLLLPFVYRLLLTILTAATE